MAPEQELSDKDKEIVEAYCDNIDKYFESFEACEDVVAVAGKKRPNSFDILFGVKPELHRSAITRYLLSNYNVFGLFTLCWKELADIAEAKTGKKKSVGRREKQINGLLESIGNITDYSDELCSEIGEKGGLLTLLTDLGTGKLGHDAMAYATTTIYNCCWRIPKNRGICRERINVLENLAESTEPKIQADAFLALSYIVDKSESHKIALNKSCVKFLLSALESALGSPDRRSPTFLYSVLEVTQGLYQLAINENNKILIMDFGGLPLLERILKGDGSSDDEKQWASRGIWQLAFKEVNRVKIRQRITVINALRKIKKTTANTNLQNACSGALFVINDVCDIQGEAQGHNHSGNHGAVGLRSSGESGQHIMISYQHASKERMLSVKRFLEQNGYTVWMDVDKMKGDILDAMAQAVQNASVFLVCMTRKYKESQHCRTEATYAYTLKKDIVPLMLEDRYAPKDWLGALMGMRKYFPMYSDDQMNQNLPELIRELGGRGKRETLVESSFQPVLSASAPAVRDQLPAAGDETDSGVSGVIDHDTGGQRREPRPLRVADVKTWSKDRVEEWLKSSGVDTSSNSFDKLDGNRLVQIHDLLYLAPEFCVRSMKDELGLSFWDLLSLVAALQRL